MKYRGKDTITKEAGNNKYFEEVKLRSSIAIQVDRMREQGKGSQEVECGDLLAVFRVIVKDGGIIRLGEGDLEVTCMKERMDGFCVTNRNG